MCARIRRLRKPEPYKGKGINTKMKLFAARPVSPVVRANRGYRYDAF